jgi:hypothetical protein
MRAEEPGERRVDEMLQRPSPPSPSPRITRAYSAPSPNMHPYIIEHGSLDELHVGPGVSAVEIDPRGAP